MSIQSPSSSHPIPFLLHIRTLALSVCFSISTLQTGSSVPFF